MIETLELLMFERPVIFVGAVFLTVAILAYLGIGLWVSFVSLLERRVNRRMQRLWEEFDRREQQLMLQKARQWAAEDAAKGRSARLLIGMEKEMREAYIDTFTRLTQPPPHREKKDT